MVKVDGVSYRVTSIADNAFKNNKKITRVVIGSNIVTIGKNSFAKCTNITSIAVGKNVTKIEKKCFLWLREVREDYDSIRETDFKIHTQICME